MAKRRKKQGKRSEVGQIMARTAHDAKVAAFRDGNYGPKAWTASNARKAASRNACRGKVAWS